MNRFFLTAREGLLSEDHRKCAYSSEGGPLKCARTKKCLPSPKYFERRVHFPESFIFLHCSFSFTICSTVTFFLPWKCCKIFPSYHICLMSNCLLKWFMQFLAGDHSLTMWLDGFVTPVSCYFIMCCKLFHMRVESLLGSMDCINEYCFATNPSLMIDEHMYFSFTCPYISVIIFCHTPTFCFLCAYQETDPAGLAVKWC